MPDATFTAWVVTPEVRLPDIKATAVVFESGQGDLTILDGHTTLVTDVVPGEVRIDPAEGAPVHLAVHGGYLQVETGQGVIEGEASGTLVTLLAGVLERAEEIDVARAETVLADATARVAALRERLGNTAGSTDDSKAGEMRSTPVAVELGAAEADCRRAEVRVEVAVHRNQL